MKNRLLAIFLCLVLCTSMFPTGASAECEHSLVKVNAKSTCAEAYREHYKCTKCGELFLDPEGEQRTTAVEIVLPKSVHESELQYVAADETVSCIKTGNREYWFCPDCKQKYATNDRSRPVSDSRVLLGYGPHNIDPESFHPAVDPTCDQSGRLAYYTCSVCDKNFADAEGETLLENVTLPPRHTLTEHPAVERTCTESGSRKYYSCSVCGAYLDEYYQPIEENDWIVAAGHDYVEHPETDPTCREAGNALYYSCSRCGIIVDADGEVTSLEEVTARKLPHSITIHVEAEPKTCEDSGNVEYWECEVCGARFADIEGSIPLDDVIIPASHNLEATEAHAATCTDDGNIAYWTCQDCEKIFNADGQQIWLNDTIEKAHGHTTERIPAQAATCTEAGHMEYYRCTECENLFSDQTGAYPTTLEAVAITALGHEYSWDGICMRCGAVRILDGDESVVASGSAYSIRLDQNYEAVKDHITVAVDGLEVAREYITVTEGSTIVTLSGDFISTLDAGEHSIAVSTPNGTAAGSFTVAAQRRLMSAGLRATTPEVYAITFNPAGSGTAYKGTSTDLIRSAAQGDTVRIVAAVPSGRQFDRWEGPEDVKFTDRNSAETTFTMPNKAVTLSAVMKYNVTFQMNGHGTQVPAQAVAPGNKAVEPRDPSASGLIFENWYEDAAFKTVFDFDEAINQDTIIYARWMYKVTFDSKYGTATPWQNVDIGKAPAKPTDPTADDYVFAEWCTDTAFQKPYDFKTAFNTAKTLYAHWKCEVTFSTKHGIAPVKQTIEIGGTPTKPTDPSMRGYKFVEWCTDKALEKKYDFKTAISKNTTLYAKWKSDLKINDGNEGTAHYGSEYDFTLNCDFDQVYIPFELKIDGKTIDPDRYELSGTKNGTEVTLKKALVRSLAAGNHTIVFDTGIDDLGSVKGTFKVSTAPKTGDESDIGLWIAVGCLSAVAVIAIVVYLIRKKK